MSRLKKALIRSKHIDQLKDRKYQSFQLHDIVKVSKLEDQVTEKITLWKVLKEIWLTLTNKADTCGNMTSSAFAVLVSITFRAVAIFGFLIFALGIYGVVSYIPELSWGGWPETIRNIYILVMIALILLFLGLYSVIMWGASNEMRKERDKNYIVAVFSGVVSFAALIIALVALVKE